MDKYHKDGKEYLDDTPVSIGAGFKRPPSIHEMIKQYVRTESFRQKAEAAGFDTEEEANDFEVEEEEDAIERFATRHELSAMAAEELRDLLGREEFDRLRKALSAPKGDDDGLGKASAGVSSVGRSGKAGKGGGGAESGTSAGDRKAASGATKSADPGELAEQG